MEASPENPLPNKFFTKETPEFVGNEPQPSVSTAEVSERDPERLKRLSELAFRIFEAEGRPEGRARDHWQKAEEMLRESESLRQREDAPQPAPEHRVETKASE